MNVLAFADMPKSQQQIMIQIGTMIQNRKRKEQEDKIKSYRALNAVAEKGGILFTGSSLMEQFPVCEIARSAGITKTIYNRGIGGTTSDDFLREIDTVLFDLEPSKVFLNIGTNDMTDRIYGAQWMDHLENNYEQILRTARERIPQAEIYCMAYYPTNQHLPDQDLFFAGMSKDRTKENLAECNRRIKALAEKYGYFYIDCNEGLADENGEQKAEFSIDGVHMLASAYLIVFDHLRQYL